MLSITDPISFQKQTLLWREQGQTIGFVPTMGYLHEGHLSLIKAAREKTDKVVVSIFVNPTQFAPHEDLASYPRDEEKDLSLVEKLDGDLVFLPSPDSMYDSGSATWVEVPELARYLCAVSRPIHFRGVCTVVSKLFHLANPHYAFFGEKDWQQLAIIRRMTKDLMFPIEIIGCPIVRENDGLAKSSRNVNLTETERVESVHIHKALELASDLVQSGNTNVEVILQKARDYIEQHIPSGEIDYLEAVDPDKITPVSHIEQNVLFAVAVKFSVVRLIDNQCVRL